MDKYDIDYIYIDSAAAQFRADLAADFGISTINAKKSILDGIAHMAGIVDNDRLIVDQNCKEILKALEAYQWDNTGVGKERPLHNWASHMSDAMRYCLYSHQTSVGSF
jgi:hypothetical protein